MKVLKVLKHFAVKLEKRNNTIFTYPVDKQKLIIEKFKEPKDDIERAFDQYMCQMKLNNPIVCFGMNLVSFPLLLFYLGRHTVNPQFLKKYDAVFFLDGKPENIIPKEIKKQFQAWQVVKEKKIFLSDDDKKYFRTVIKQHPFSWYFLLKCVLKIGFYSYEIERYRPTAFVVCNEYSFTSSMLTHYCNMRNVRHINVMHGEKVYDITDSFFRFNECYVWSLTYADLFKTLRAEQTQFKVAIPESLIFSGKYNTDKQFDFTYYLGAEENKVLDKIINILNILVTKGYRVAIRPHPRYSDIDEIDGKCKTIEIEKTDCVTIEESILRTQNAISLYSTALIQAFYNGTGVVIDDVTRPDFYLKLKELQYGMLAMEHKELSDFI